MSMLLLLLSPLILIAGTAPIGATVCGAVAISRIRRSQGRLHGLPLAVAATLLFPLLVLDGIILFACVELSHLFRVGTLVMDWYQPMVSKSATREIGFVVAFVVCAIVDVLICRWAWRAASSTGETSRPQPLATPQPPTMPQTPNASQRSRLLLIPLVGLRNGRRAINWAALVMSLVLAAAIVAFFIITKAKQEATVVVGLVLTVRILVGLLRGWAVPKDRLRPLDFSQQPAASGQGRRVGVPVVGHRGDRNPVPPGPAQSRVRVLSLVSLAIDLVLLAVFAFLLVPMQVAYGFMFSDTHVALPRLTVIALSLDAWVWRLLAGIAVAVLIAKEFMPYKKATLAVNAVGIAILGGLCLLYGAAFSVPAMAMINSLMGKPSSALSTAHRSPFPKTDARTYSGADAAYSALVVHDNIDLHYVLFYPGDWEGAATRGSQNAQSHTWVDDGSVRLRNGRTFGYAWTSADPSHLTINGRESDLRSGRVFVLRDDGSHLQLELRPTLADARDVRTLGNFVAGDLAALEFRGSATVEDAISGFARASAAGMVVLGDDGELTFQQIPAGGGEASARMRPEEIAEKAGKGDAFLLNGRLYGVRGTVVAPLKLPEIKFHGEQSEQQFITAIRHMSSMQVNEQIAKHLRTVPNPSMPFAEMADQQIYVLRRADGRLWFFLASKHFDNKYVFVVAAVPSPATKPAGTSSDSWTGEFAGLPTEATVYVIDKAMETYSAAKEKGVFANSRVFTVTSDFKLRTAGLLTFENISDKPMSGEIPLGIFDSKDHAFEDISVGKPKIRWEDRGAVLKFGRYQFYWTPDKPIPPGAYHVLAWLSPGVMPLTVRDGGAALKMANFPGPQSVESFFLILPKAMEVVSLSKWKNRVDIGGFTIYQWQDEVRANTEHAVGITILPASVTRTTNPASAPASQPHVSAPAAEPAWREVRIPDADTKGVPVILDLATGKMLEAPTEGGGRDPFSHFTSLGQGDIGFDRVIFVLRGGKLVTANGTPYEPKQVKGDATAYDLAILYEEVLVKTGSGLTFRLKAVPPSSPDPKEVLVRYAPVTRTTNPAPAPTAKEWTGDIDALPAAVTSYIVDKHMDTYKAGKDKGVFSLSQVYALGTDGNLHRAGLLTFENISDKPMSDEIPLAVFDSSKDMRFEDVSIGPAKIRWFDRGPDLKYGRYQAFWQPDKPIPPGAYHVLAYIRSGSTPLTWRGGGAKIKMENCPGIQAVESFFLVLPRGAELADSTSEWKNRVTVGGYEVYQWQDEVRADANHEVSATVVQTSRPSMTSTSAPASMPTEESARQAAQKFMRAFRDKDLDTMVSMSLIRLSDEAVRQMSERPPAGLSRLGLEGLLEVHTRVGDAKVLDRLLNVGQIERNGDWAGVRIEVDEPDAGTSRPSSHYLIAVFLWREGQWRLVDIDDTSKPLRESLAGRVSRYRTILAASRPITTLAATSQPATTASAAKEALRVASDFMSAVATDDRKAGEKLAVEFPSLPVKIPTSGPAMGFDALWDTATMVYKQYKGHEELLRQPHEPAVLGVNAVVAFPLPGEKENVTAISMVAHDGRWRVASVSVPKLRDIKLTESVKVGDSESVTVGGYTTMTTTTSASTSRPASRPAWLPTSGPSPSASAPAATRTLTVTVRNAGYGVADREFERAADAVDALVKIANSWSTPLAQVEIRVIADSQVQYAQVTQVYELLVKAGFTNVLFASSGAKPAATSNP